MTAPRTTSARAAVPAPRAATDGVAVYGLLRPDLRTAREHVAEVCAPGTDVDAVWGGLLERAGLRGTETDVSAVERAVAALRSDPDPVLVLCGRALHIRLSAYQHLLTARLTIPEERA